MFTSIFVKNIDTNHVVFKTYVSMLIILSIKFISIMYHRMVNIIIQFHQRYNEVNLNRNPIKFLMENQVKLKRIFTIIWFLGSIVMLSGIWFGK